MKQKSEPEVKENRRITLASRVSVEMEEKKSVFIGHAAPVADENEARAFIEEIRHKYSDATHNVYAYLLQDGSVARYSDDGEPHGTSGIPTLNVLKMSGACDLCVVVTRYFGGILLGAGGLVRAYSAAAKMAIDAAGMAVFEPWNVVLIECSYSDYQKLTAGFARMDVVEEKADFGSSVLIQAAMEATRTEEIRVAVSEMTGGRASFEIVYSEERASRQNTENL